nr:k(+) efflux antiporter (KEA) [Polytomella parva]|eukprot:CAMPEP_0175070622 /NCGR_PEP_ID=MMETSP0052_2-20121109/18813_1 /TAXON_ID=51329 ORGANISM="Polytomella parva, Strain SAG 63-3" /NCGR_SAMPLE_ID=MMETSP0052_2 /ASSEMBLY_ACC=CAM_ASM_000194 /LENGTH=1357 /DNA_ID=CAMNT_0016337749 /DNA_START=190 /DNA_END=4263 /DNA_ORIENTATION=-
MSFITPTPCFRRRAATSLSLPSVSTKALSQRRIPVAIKQCSNKLNTPRLSSLLCATPNDSPSTESGSPTTHPVETEVVASLIADAAVRNIPSSSNLTSKDKANHGSTFALALTERSTTTAPLTQALEMARVRHVSLQKKRARLEVEAQAVAQMAVEANEAMKRAKAELLMAVQAIETSCRQEQAWKDKVTLLTDKVAASKLAVTVAETQLAGAKDALVAAVAAVRKADEDMVVAEAAVVDAHTHDAIAKEAANTAATAVAEAKAPLTAMEGTLAAKRAELRKGHEASTAAAAAATAAAATTSPTASASTATPVEQSTNSAETVSDITPADAPAPTTTSPATASVPDFEDNEEIKAIRAQLKELEAKYASAVSFEAEKQREAEAAAQALAACEKAKQVAVSTDQLAFRAQEQTKAKISAAETALSAANASTVSLSEELRLSEAAVEEMKARISVLRVAMEDLNSKFLAAEGVSLKADEVAKQAMLAAELAVKDEMESMAIIKETEDACDKASKDLQSLRKSSVEEGGGAANGSGASGLSADGSATISTSPSSASPSTPYSSASDWVGTIITASVTASSSSTPSQGSGNGGSFSSSSSSTSSSSSSSSSSAATPITAEVLASIDMESSSSTTADTATAAAAAASHNAHPAVAAATAAAVKAAGPVGSFLSAVLDSLRANAVLMGVFTQIQSLISAMYGKLPPNARLLLSAAAAVVFFGAFAKSVVGRAIFSVVGHAVSHLHGPERALLEVLLLLATSITCVPLVVKGIPGGNAVLGYLLGGALIGPHCFGLIGDAHNIKHLAEMGVVLLLFNIGLELSLDRLQSMAKLVFGMGSLQVLLTLLVAAAFSVLKLGLPVPAAIIIGGSLAMSSTAVAIQVLEERKEMGSRHGRATFSVLLFQDLAVVVLLMLIPLLAPNPNGGAAGAGRIIAALGVAAVKAVIAVVGIIAGGRMIVSPLYKRVSEFDNPEIFAATTLLVCLGTAFLTQLAGLSLALGAFLAGLVIAETEFALQVESDIAPYKGLLMNLFFMGVGMEISPALLAQRWASVAVAIVLLIASKTYIMAAVGPLFGLSKTAALRAGLLLAPGGEFAFVAFGEAVARNVMPAGLANFMYLVVALSMALTPYLAAFGEKAAQMTDKSDIKALAPSGDEAEGLRNHVIIAGYGRSGQLIAQMLSAQRIPFVAMDVNSDRVSAGKSKDNPVYFGDAGSPSVLHLLGAERAACAVVALDSPGANYRAVYALSKHYPNVRIFVRAYDMAHGEKLEKAGATAVIPAVLEPSLQLAAAVLREFKYGPDEVTTVVDHFRKRNMGDLKSLSGLSGTTLGYGFVPTVGEVKTPAAENAGAAAAAAVAAAVAAATAKA